MSSVKAYLQLERQKIVQGGNLIRSHLGRLMGERKLKIADVARETGVHRNAITLLYREEATRIDVETIDKLCALFDCAVADLLEYVPNEGKAADAARSAVKRTRRKVSRAT